MLTSELKELKLKYGVNKIQYSIDVSDRDDNKKTPKMVSANVYLWKSSDKIVISDIDGTITKSDIRGTVISHIIYILIHRKAYLGY